MPPTRRTPYTAVSLTSQTRDDLQTLALDMSARVGKRFSLSAIVAAVLAVASRHPDELADELQTEGNTT